MDAPPVIVQRSTRRSGLFLVSAACGVVVVALGLIGYLLRQFYADTASLAPGTEIRPMGVTLFLGLTWTASILFGGGCALAGGIRSIKQRHWILAVCATLAGFASWIAMFVSNWGFDRIVALRKLVLEP